MCDTFLAFLTLIKGLMCPIVPNILNDNVLQGACKAEAGGAEGGAPAEGRSQPTEISQGWKGEGSCESRTLASKIYKERDAGCGGGGARGVGLFVHL